MRLPIATPNKLSHVSIYPIYPSEYFLFCATGNNLICGQHSFITTNVIFFYYFAGEDCIMSSDCDITKGLCCQVQRRHRQAPRKVSNQIAINKLNFKS